MASTYSDRLKLELMATGSNAATWGTNTNNNLEVIDAYANGYVAIDVGGSSNVTLTASDASPTSESSNKVIEFQELLTGNVTVLVPARESNYLVYNNTSGSFDLSVGCDNGANGAVGTTATIGQGAYSWIYSDGTNVTLAELGGNASAIYTGTLDDARLSANVTLNNASTISTGTLADARLTANVTLNNASTISTGTLDQARLANAGITINGSTVNLGSSVTVGTIEGVTAGNGLTGGGSSGTINIAVGAGTGINLGADAISVDVSDFMSNGSNNRVLTATGTDAMNAESGLTFNGQLLDINHASEPRLELDNGTATTRFYSNIASGLNMNYLDLNQGGSVSTVNLFIENNGSRIFRIFGGSDVNTYIGETSTTGLGTTTYGAVFDGLNSSGVYAGYTYRQSANRSGSSSVAQWFGNAGEFRIKGDGDAENTNNRYTGISDIRLKENVIDANSQWDDVKSMRIRKYNFIEYPDRTHIGLIAQELEEAGMSKLVNHNDDLFYTEKDQELGEIPAGKQIGDVKEVGYKSVAYSVIHLKALKALQEAMDRIETLEAQVAALQN